MPGQLKCQVCGGIYPDTTGPGKIRYYHACPPILNPAYQPDPTKPLFNLVQFIERPGKIDENIASYDPKTDTLTIVAPGAPPISV